MKPFIYGILSGFIVLVFYWFICFYSVKHKEVELLTNETVLENAWISICQVESNNNPEAVGDNGKAIGIAQIHSIMVEDCNRIVGEERWDHPDAWEVKASHNMFIVYSTYYSEYYNDWSLEGICRRWNGGPDGHLEEETVSYWRKIKETL